MNDQFAIIRDQFLAALERNSLEEQLKYAEEHCGDTPELRDKLVEMIRAHHQSEGFLASRIEATDIFPVTETPGDTIGPYKLLQQIGEGGMGVVYMAEQSSPVERRVALKIIKPGMDTQQVIARFEAERQALAMMDHPNIAKVLDAGQTDSGRPYFVMELVKGIPVTQYCDEQHLSPRERLELFVPICHAVQHAHQKGIIHRDLKPSNILIAQYDDKPVPKVIDFGVAKAISHNLTEKTMFTQYGQIVGTIEYMSPEQARFNQLDVDTRSDIYSLGVLLYELLTGETPFDKKRLRAAAFDELLRIIREEEPPRPSTRLSSSETLANTAINRKTEPKKLSLLVRGELDWIVMKALEKDRNRRYETANGFAADVQRYLNDEQVLACPPSGGYRLRKFVRRNKGRLVTTTLLATALLITVGGVGWALRDRAAQRAEIESERQDHEAEIAQKQEQRLIRTRTRVELILAEVERLMHEQHWEEALSAVRRAEAVVTSSDADAAIAARVRGRLKDLEFVDRLEQIRMHATSIGGKFDYAGTDRGYLSAFREFGLDLDTLPVDASIERLKPNPALVVPLAAALDEWVHARRNVSTNTEPWNRLVAVARGIDPDPFRDRLRSSWGQAVTDQSRDELRKLAESVDVRAQSPATLVSLERTLFRVEQMDAALQLLRSAYYIYPGDFWLNFDLGNILSARKDHEGALRFFTACVAIRPNSSATHFNLGICLRELSMLDEAHTTCQKAIEIDSKLAGAYTNCGAHLNRLGKVDEAIAAYQQAIALDSHEMRAYSNLSNTLLMQRKINEAITVAQEAVAVDPNFALGYASLGTALQKGGRIDEAIDALRKAIELDPTIADAFGNLSVALASQGKLAEAAANCRRAIELNPTANHHANLGIYLQRLGEFQEAEAACRKAIELDPEGQSGAYYTLGLIIQQQNKDIDDAVDALRRAVELNPKGSWYYSLSRALLKQGTFDESISTLRIASKDAPQNPHFHEQLARLLANCPDVTLRNREQALDHARRATELRPEYLQSAFGIFRVAEYWTEAIEFGVKLIERNADCESWAYLPIAAVAVRAADRAAYADVCGTMLQRFADSENIEDAERVTKACLLWPAVFDSSMLPADKFTKTLDDGTASDGFKPWGWAARALLAYRSGNPEAAMEYVARSEESSPGEFTRAMNLPVLALAQHQLQQADEARTTLEEASQLITRLKDDSDKKGDANLLIAEILFGEAKANINGDEAADKQSGSTSELKPLATSNED